MQAHSFRKSIVLALALALLGGPLLILTAEALPPRGRPTSPPHIRAWKGLKNFFGRTPSHRRPAAPQPSAAAAAVGNPPPANQPPARRLDSQGRPARQSRSGLHRDGSRSGSRRNLSRHSTRNLRAGGSRRAVHHYQDARGVHGPPRDASAPATVATYGNASAARPLNQYGRVTPEDWLQAGRQPPGANAGPATTTTTTTTSAAPSTLPPWGGVGPPRQPSNSRNADPSTVPWGGARPGWELRRPLPPTPPTAGGAAPSGQPLAAPPTQGGRNLPNPSNRGNNP
jgi:hypothetical protein